MALVAGFDGYSKKILRSKNYLILRKLQRFRLDYDVLEDTQQVYSYLRFEELNN